MNPNGSWRWRVGVCLLALAGQRALADAQAYVNAVKASAPVSYWQFEDASSANGATVADAMSVNPGTYNNSVSLGTGIAGNAATFSGTAYLNVPNSASLALNTMSVEFWFKSSQVWNATYWPGSATFLSKGTAGGNSSDWCVLAGSSVGGSNNGQVIGASGPGGTGGDKTTLSANGFNDGNWHHAVWTRSSLGVQSLYVDGRLQSTAQDNGGSIVNTRAVQIGGDPFLSGAYLNGQMDEVAIYNRILTGTEIAQHCALLKPNAINGGATVGLKVDSGMTGQGVQSGYTAWTGAAQPNYPVAAVFTNCFLGLDRQTVSAVVDVSGFNAGGSTAGGFYNGTGVSGSYANLFNDYFFGRKTLTFTLSSIRKGDYVLKTHHHEAAGAGTVLLNLGLTCGESAVSQNGVSQTSGVLPSAGRQGGGVGAAAALPFTADGTSDVTLNLVRQTTGANDNAAINGFELHKLGDLRVDLGQASTPTQTGFTAWHFAANDANPHSMTFTGVDLRKGPNTFTVTVEPQGVNVWGAATGGTAADTQTGSGGPMDNLASGAYFARRDMIVTISGLLAATYNLVTFHRGQSGILDTTLTDADGTQTGTVLQSGSGGTPGDVGIGDFAFRSDGVNPVVLRLHTPNSGGIPDNAYLNGFTLVTTPTQGTVIVIR